MDSYKSRLATLQAKKLVSTKYADDTEAELVALIKKAETAEGLAKEKTAELLDIEDQLDAAESRLKGYAIEFESAEMGCEQRGQALKQLKNRQSTYWTRTEKLELELHELKMANETVMENLDQLLLKVSEAEDILEKEEERMDKAEARVKVLETTATQVGSSLRSKEINEQNISGRVSSGDFRIQEAECKYQLMEKDASTMEARAKDLEEVMGEKDEELNCIKLNYDAVKVELETMVSEINEL